MPVNLLLCEGGANSPDVRVLGKLLAGLCKIQPEGGKYGMGSKIIDRRKFLGNVVSGILDGDFLRDWFRENDFIGAWAFREKVLNGMASTGDDISSWMPEWAHLRQLMQDEA